MLGSPHAALSSLSAQIWLTPNIHHIPSEFWHTQAAEHWVCDSLGRAKAPRPISRRGRSCPAQGSPAASLTPGPPGI